MDERMKREAMAYEVEQYLDEHPTATVAQVCTALPHVPTDIVRGTHEEYAWCYRMKQELDEVLNPEA